MKKTESYAVRALVLLAQKPFDRFSVAYLHKNLDVPYKYLTKIMTKLAREGIVKAIRGRDGGFMLSRRPEEIMLGDILLSISKSSFKSNDCVLGLEECDSENPCALHEQWIGIAEGLEKILKTTSLADMAKSTKNYFDNT